MSEPTATDIEKARKLLTPEMKQALGLYSKKERVSLTERGMLRINASAGFGRNKGSSVGRYKATQYTPEGTYGWLTGVPSQVVTDDETSTVSVIVTEKVTPEEMAIVKGWVERKAFTIPKERKQEAPEKPSVPSTSTHKTPPTPTPETATPTQTPETDSSQLSVTKLASMLSDKLKIELKDALTLVKEDRAEAENLLRE